MIVDCGRSAPGGPPPSLEWKYPVVHHRPNACLPTLVLTYDYERSIKQQIHIRYIRYNTQYIDTQPQLQSEGDLSHNLLHPTLNAHIEKIR